MRENILTWKKKPKRMSTNNHYNMQRNAFVNSRLFFILSSGCIDSLSDIVRVNKNMFHLKRLHASHRNRLKLNRSIVHMYAPRSYWREVNGILCCISALVFVCCVIGIIRNFNHFFVGWTLNSVCAQQPKRYERIRCVNSENVFSGEISCGIVDTVRAMD